MISSYTRWFSFSQVTDKDNTTIQVTWRISGNKKNKKKISKHKAR